MKVSEPLAVKSSGFFVALSKLKRYKPTFDQLRVTGFSVQS
jgi:hypothetical protein